MKLKQQIQLITAFPAFLLVLVGSLSVTFFFIIDQKIGTIYDDRVVPLTQIKTVSDAYAITIVDSINKYNSSSITAQEALELVQEAEREIGINWEKYKQTYLTAKEKQLIEEISSLFSESKNPLENLKRNLARNDKTRLAQWDRDIYKIIDPITSKLGELITLQNQIAENERLAADRVFRTILMVFIPLVIACIVLVLSPLKNLLSRALTAAIEETIANVANASLEIAAATEQQERIASQQATSIQETTTTVEELEVTSKQSALQAGNVANNAKEVLELSEQGNEAVENSLVEMSELSVNVKGLAEQSFQLRDQAQQITTISQLVGEIANQTNMLALNASIEAVRAGEQGKGFSVVATEIRKLAEQSEESAEQIRQLSQDIQGAIETTVSISENGMIKVEKGVKLAKSSSQAFKGVTNAIGEVANSSQQIALSVQQQNQAIQQILQAMNDLNQAAQESRNGIRQTKVGMEKLKETSLDLKGMV